MQSKYIFYVGINFFELKYEDCSIEVRLGVVKFFLFQRISINIRHEIHCSTSM